MTNGVEQPHAGEVASGNFGVVGPQPPRVERYGFKTVGVDGQVDVAGVEVEVANVSGAEFLLSVAGCLDYVTEGEIVGPRSPGTTH